MSFCGELRVPVYSLDGPAPKINLLNHSVSQLSNLVRFISLIFYVTEWNILVVTFRKGH